MNQKRNVYETVIGIGGLHYCYTFNKMLLNTKYAISHICPKYQLENLNSEILNQAIKKTQEDVKSILIDWKGTPNKEKIIKLAESLNLNILRTDRL